MKVTKFRNRVVSFVRFELTIDVRFEVGELWCYHETETDGNDNGSDDGDGGEVEVTEVAGEGLGDDSDGEHGDAAEDGGACYLP